MRPFLPDLPEKTPETKLRKSAASLHCFLPKANQYFPL